MRQTYELTELYKVEISVQSLTDLEKSFSLAKELS